MLLCACSSLSGPRYGQIAQPSPANWGEGESDADPLGGPLPDESGDGEPQEAQPAAPGTPQGQSAADAQAQLSAPATEWVDRALGLWREGHFAASVDAMHEALSTQDLNDAGQALAYWHIYLAEQALGHGGRGNDALADFVAVANDMVAMAQAGSQPDFVHQFDLSGRLMRARATLNLAWAQKTRRAGYSLSHPVLVFDEAEMEHFLEIVPACAKTHARKVVALERRQDLLGRCTAKATIRCHPERHERNFYFAFIGPSARSGGSLVGVSQ